MSKLTRTDYKFHLSDALADANELFFTNPNILVLNWNIVVEKPTKNSSKYSVVAEVEDVLTSDETGLMSIEVRQYEPDRSMSAMLDN